MGDEKIPNFSQEELKKIFGRSFTASDLIKLSINLTNKIPSKQVEKCCFHMLKTLISGTEGLLVGELLVCSCQKSRKQREMAFPAANGWERLLGY